MVHVIRARMPAHGNAHLHIQGLIVKKKSRRAGGATPALCSHVDSCDGLHVKANVPREISSMTRVHTHLSGGCAVPSTGTSRHLPVQLTIQSHVPVRGFVKKKKELSKLNSFIMIYELPFTVPASARVSSF